MRNRVSACLLFIGLIVAAAPTFASEPADKRDASAVAATPWEIQIGSGRLCGALAPGSVCLTVDDVRGTYTLPYIQPDRNLSIKIKSRDAALKQLRLALQKSEGAPRTKTVEAKEAEVVVYKDLAPGEYTLTVAGLDAQGQQVHSATYRRIGIGTIVAAIGDSITEGYWAKPYEAEEHLNWTMFPKAAVSRDGRNFPQFAPTTHRLLKKHHAFGGFETQLNDLLAETLQHPVLVANEGWGGYTSAQYLTMMTEDRNWQNRLRALRPTWWIIQLGVNDERHLVPAEQFGEQMEKIADILIKDYGAVPQRILLAKPCYDYYRGAEPILKTYNQQIDRLIERRQLGAGADFFAAYAQDRQRLYGKDPVHPNEAGMTLMAQLWHESLAAALAAESASEK